MRVAVTGVADLYDDEDNLVGTWTSQNARRPMRSGVPHNAYSLARVAASGSAARPPPCRLKGTR